MWTQQISDLMAHSVQKDQTVQTTNGPGFWLLGAAGVLGLAGGILAFFAGRAKTARLAAVPAPYPPQGYGQPGYGPPQAGYGQQQSGYTQPPAYGFPAQQVPQPAPQQPMPPEAG